MPKQFITQISAHNFVVREEDALVPQVVGSFVASEVRQGNSPDQMANGSATWSFEMRDEEGNILGQVAPGWWQAFSAIMSAFTGQFESDPAFSADWVEFSKVGLVPVCLMTPDGLGADAPSAPAAEPGPGTS